MDLKSKIRVIEDFPIQGISFKDITTLIRDKDAFKYVVDEISKNLKDKEIDYIVGPEARGFLFGAAVAYAMGIGFVPIRKPGKLPGSISANEYMLEYGTNTLEIQTDALQSGDRIAIVDDLLATGGTMASAAELIESLGAKVVAMEFLIELESLKGKDKLKKYHINSLVKYDR